MIPSWTKDGSGYVMSFGSYTFRYYPLERKVTRTSHYKGVEETIGVVSDPTTLTTHRLTSRFTAAKKQGRLRTRKVGNEEDHHRDHCLGPSAIDGDGTAGK